MLRAVWFRYVRTLWRSRIDSASMMVRPLITAVLFVMFASAVAPDEGSRAFLVVSVMIVNVVANTVIGAAYEARTDVAGGRLELVVQSPGGLSGYVSAQAAVQLVVALAQSCLVGVWWFTTLAVHAWDPVWLAALVVLCVTTWGLAALGAWEAVVRGSFVSTSFTISMLLTFAGSFYPVEALPEWARAVSLVNPLTYLVDLVRAPVIAEPTLENPGQQLAFAGAIAIILLLVVAARVRHRPDLSAMKPVG